MQNLLRISLHLDLRKPGIDYRIHSADEFILVSGMEEAVLVYYGSNQESSGNLMKMMEQLLNGEQNMKAAVFFPGIGYHCDKPLLYYSRSWRRNVAMKKQLH